MLAGLFSELRWSLVDAGSLQPHYARDAVRAGSFTGGREAVRRFRRERAADRTGRAAARAVLEANIGVQGVGPDGRMLDRREFAATKHALLKLLYAHMGWYQQEKRRNAYRHDLLDMLAAGDDRMVFDPPMKTGVRADGQAWYAYRETPSGLVFGLGANGPPPSSWYYTANLPPRGYPPGPGWSPFIEQTPIEWMDEPLT